MGEERSTSQNVKTKPENIKNDFSKDPMPGSEIWTNGLICAFECVRRHRKSARKKMSSNTQSTNQVDSRNIDKQVPMFGGIEASPQKSNGRDILESTSLAEFGDDQVGSLSDSNKSQPGHLHTLERVDDNHWVPIGWSRIFELVQTVQVNAGWVSQQFDFLDDEDDRTIADLAAPYWERAAGPVWWCHVAAGHPFIDSWLNNAQWLHPAISIALRDENRLISERMKHLLYEVPVRVAGGLLFELLGQSAGDPYVEEDDVPVVLRSWQAQNFLITALHIKGAALSVNVLGIAEVQELLYAGGNNTPRTVHEVVALLACRMARWDDRRSEEDLNLFGVILNQEIRRLSIQVIRVKWSLHAREEIVFELLQHLRGNAARSLLEGIRKSTREMIEEQEAVRGRLFTIQDVMQSTKRAWLQDRSLRVTHNLAVFGGVGLILSIITGLFGINVDGIPGAENTPYAFGVFAATLFFIGVVLIALGLIYLGLKKPINEEQVEVRKLELQELVKMFQHEAETHAQVRKPVSRHNLPPTAADFLNDADYILIH